MSEPKEERVHREPGTPSGEDWTCGQCGIPLEPGKVKITYMGSEFTVELPRCKRCGIVLVPEELATGKMAEVEKILEDK